MRTIISGSLYSQPTRSVVWVCELLNVPYSFVDMKTARGDHLTDKFLSKNPNGKFPVLEEEEDEEEEEQQQKKQKQTGGARFALWEGNAIMRYLVNRYAPDCDLYPASPVSTRAHIDQWMDWKHTIRAGTGGMVRREAFARVSKDISKHSMRFDLVELPAARDRRLLMEQLNILEGHLQGRSYLVTDKPTLADIAVFEEVEHLAFLPVDVPPPLGCDFVAGGYSNIDRWVQRMRTLRGYGTVHEALLAFAPVTREAVSAAYKVSKSKL